MGEWSNERNEENIRDLSALRRSAAKQRRPSFSIRSLEDEGRCVTISHKHIVYISQEESFFIGTVGNIFDVKGVADCFFSRLDCVYGVQSKMY